MPDPTYTDGLPMRHYLSLDALSSSRLKPALISRAHYEAARYAQRTATVDMRIGTALHSLLLTPGQMAEEIAIAPDKATTRNTKAYKEFADGADPWVEILLQSEYAQAQAMAEAAKVDPLAGPLLKALKGAERTCEWAEAGQPAKARIDGWVEIDGKTWLLDVKSTRNATTSRYGDGQAFHAQSWDLLYHMQLAWYRRGWMACVGPVEGALILAVEKTPPYACRVYDMTTLLADGDECIERALTAIADDSPPTIETMPKPGWAQYQENA